VEETDCGVLDKYAAGSVDDTNAADGPFSAAEYRRERDRTADLMHVKHAL
jgi:hypothetical protein